MSGMSNTQSVRLNSRVTACRVVGSEKPVFGAEYCDATAAGNGVTQDPGCYCPEALSSGRNVLIKTTDLNDKVRAHAHNCGAGAAVRLSMPALLFGALL